MQQLPTKSPGKFPLLGTATINTSSAVSGVCHPTMLPSSPDHAEIPERCVAPSTSTISHPSTPALFESPTDLACTSSIPPTLLPAYKACADPYFTWGSLDGKTFTETISTVYSEVVHWRRNLFKVPSGKAGNLFVKELSRLFAAYVDDSALQLVALSAAMVVPALVLQKPSKTSKSKEHTRLLERRLSLWLDGRLFDLLHEGRTIQRRLRSSQSKNSNECYIKKQFSKLMWEGKVKAALKLLRDTPSTGILPWIN